MNFDYFSSIGSDWDIAFEFENIEDTAETHISFSHKRAKVILNPYKIKNDDILITNIIHELCHILIRDFELLPMFIPEEYHNHLDCSNERIVASFVAFLKKIKPELFNVPII